MESTVEGKAAKTEERKGILDMRKMRINGDKRGNRWIPSGYRTDWGWVNYDAGALSKSGATREVTVVIHNAILGLTEHFNDTLKYEQGGKIVVFGETPGMRAKIQKGIQRMEERMDEYYFQYPHRWVEDCCIYPQDPTAPFFTNEQMAYLRLPTYEPDGELIGLFTSELDVTTEEVYRRVHNISTRGEGWSNDLLSNNFRGFVAKHVAWNGDWSRLLVLIARETVVNTLCYKRRSSERTELFKHKDSIDRMLARIHTRAVYDYHRAWDNRHMTVETLDLTPYKPLTLPKFWQDYPVPRTTDFNATVGDRVMRALAVDGTLEEVHTILQWGRWYDEFLRTFTFSVTLNSVWPCKLAMSEDNPLRNIGNV